MSPYCPKFPECGCESQFCCKISKDFSDEIERLKQKEEAKFYGKQRKKVTNFTPKKKKRK